MYSKNLLLVSAFGAALFPAHAQNYNQYASPFDSPTAAFASPWETTPAHQLGSPFDGQQEQAAAQYLQQTGQSDAAYQQQMSGVAAAAQGYTPPPPPPPGDRRVRVSSTTSIQGCNPGLLKIRGTYVCRTHAYVSEGGFIPDPVVVVAASTPSENTPAPMPDGIVGQGCNGTNMLGWYADGSQVDLGPSAACGSPVAENAPVPPSIPAPDIFTFCSDGFMLVTVQNGVYTAMEPNSAACGYTEWVATYWGGGGNGGGGHGVGTGGTTSVRSGDGSHVSSGDGSHVTSSGGGGSHSVGGGG